MQAPGNGVDDGVITLLKRGHDALTRVSFGVAILCLAFIAAGFCYEVVVRYFFDAPTNWVHPFTSYALCLMIFLALPAMTQAAGHISIDMLLEKVPPKALFILRKFGALTGVLACTAAAWITGTETVSQFIGNISTIAHNPLPKWTISCAIPYGFLSAGLYFARQLCAEPVQVPAERVAV